MAEIRGNSNRDDSWRTAIHVRSSADFREDRKPTENAFKCPHCKQPATTLLICGRKKHGFLTCRGCEPCYTERSSFDWKLHQKDGGVSRGKAWEIDHRTVSKEDGRTVINRLTGKPAQF